MSTTTTDSVPSSLGHVDRYMNDMDAMFEQYTMAGGASPRDEYAKALRLFFHHTLNSHVFGLDAADYGGAPFDQDGFALYARPADCNAEDALKVEASIDDREVARIFHSVDSVHCYSQVERDVCRACFDQMEAHSATWALVCRHPFARDHVVMVIDA